MHKHLPSRRANNIITNFAALLLVLIGILHLVRAVQGWEVHIANFELPIWVSWFALLLAFYIAYTLFYMDKSR